ncbi:MAG: hypothetical protein Q9160_008362 [Pyrenula sp. 1 TL-2023]
MLAHHVSKASLLLFLLSSLAASHPLIEERDASPGVPTFTACIVYVNARDVISTATPAATHHTFHLPGSGNHCESTDIIKRTITIYPTPEPEIVLKESEPSLASSEPTLITTTIQTTLYKRARTTDYVNARRTASPDPIPTLKPCPGGFVNARGEPVDPLASPNLDTRDQLECAPHSGDDSLSRRSLSISDDLEREQAHVGPILTPCPGGYVNARGEPVDGLDRRDGDGSSCAPPPGAGSGAKTRRSAEPVA